MAARALYRSRHKNTGELLYFLVGDQDRRVRSAAVMGVGYQRDEKAYETLLNIIENDESSYVKGRAVYALGMFNTDESMDKLVSSLKASLAVVRISAASALGKTEDKRAIEPLLRALRDPEDKVRAAAAESLQQLTGQEELYGRTRELPGEEAYAAWREWWTANGDEFQVAKKSLRYYRSAEEWISRLDEDGNGCLDQEELQAGLDSFFGTK
jgi:HEAT repeat protein